MSVLQSQPGGGPMREFQVEGWASVPLNQPIREQNRTRWWNMVFLLIKITVTRLLPDREETMRKRVFNPFVFLMYFPFGSGKGRIRNGKNGCVYLWGREGRPEGAREEVTSWRWWSRWWTQPLFASLHPLSKRGFGGGHALSTPTPTSHPALWWLCETL